MIDLSKAIPKLDEVEQRFNGLNDQMADPEVFSNLEFLRKIGKEKAELEDTVSIYRQYKDATRGIEENQELLRDDADLRDLASEELDRLVPLRNRLADQLLRLLVPIDPLDKRDVFLEIRAGTGGDEAALFAANLFRMYGRFAEERGWTVEIVHINETELGGLKEVIAQIRGKRVYSFLKFEGGVHRVQRVPETEAQGRIHTSAVTVAILPEAEEEEIVIDKGDIREDIYRASGAGGQHINKTDSAIRLTHLPTGLVVTCQDERSQHKNRAKAYSILSARLAERQREASSAEEQGLRRSMVGSGDRSERIRTYNYPQNRLTDHRIGLTLYRLDALMEGDLRELIEALQAYYSAARLIS